MSGRAGYLARRWRRVLVWAVSAVAVAACLAGTALGGLWYVSRSPEYCGWCHVMDPYFTSWKASGNLAHQHSVSEIVCQDCHPQSMSDLLREIAVTLRRSYRVPLPTKKVAKEECLACHGDYASLASATEHLETNPHATHLGEEECRQCHRMHRTSPGMNYCFTCHHTGDLSSCDRCHANR